MQYRLLAIDYHCMTGIMTTLKACDSLYAISQHIDNLSFSFVTPLGADNNYIFSHNYVTTHVPFDFSSFFHAGLL